MSLEVEAKINILNDHYKDTFPYLIEYIKRRDRFLLYVILVLGLQFISITTDTDSTGILKGFMESKVGFKLNITPEIFNILIF
ncbi:MAG: hypothetical protein H6622_00370 [Halobacteriovoraceae bacterium]|nr:hypothetical protein [Halobacteriovoraceae bacterium]